MSVCKLDALAAAVKAQSAWHDTRSIILSFWNPDAWDAAHAALDVLLEK